MKSIHATATGGSPPPPQPREESPAERFRRLAEFRMSKLEQRIAQVVNLAGPGYESTADQREKIVNAVFKYAHAVKAAFEKTGKDRRGFTF